MTIEEAKIISKAMSILGSRTSPRKAKASRANGLKRRAPAGGKKSSARAKKS